MIYINGIGSVSAQELGNENNFSSNYVTLQNQVLHAVKAPHYKQYISPANARRMAKGLKNATVASKNAIEESGVENFDAIITGTGMGCIEDSDKFLTAIIDNDEQFLTPTAFIQSTHNTVAANIALSLGCKSYNFTYVNGSVSFESALYDAKLQLDSGDAENILIGGIDEMTDYNAELLKLAGFLKKEITETSGATFSEGATFFVLSNQKSSSTYCQIVDVEMMNILESNEVEDFALNFLKQNNLSINDIDAVIFGINDDVNFENYYADLKLLFKDTPQAQYKNLSGEYNTSSAFGLMCGANIIKEQSLPEIMSINNLKSDFYKNILLYNQYRGIDHSFVLISKS